MSWTAFQCGGLPGGVRKVERLEKNKVLKNILGADRKAAAF